MMDVDVDDVHVDRLQFVVFSHSTFNCAELLQIPGQVSPEDVEAFQDTFVSQVPIRAAMLWETEFMIKYPLPFFQVRVADVRASLGSGTTAVELYLQAQAALGVGHDPVFDAFLEGYRTDVEDQVLVDEQIDRDIEQFVSEKETVQPYKPAKAHPRPAVMRMISLKETKETIGPLWGPLGMTEPLWDRYLNAYSIEMCMMDGAFELVPQSARKLARDGLNPASVDCTSTSRTKNAGHIVAMIRDFKAAYYSTIEISRQYADRLNPVELKRIHAIAMQSSRFLPNLGDHQVEQPDPRDWKYVNIGRSRTETRTKLELKPNADTTQKTCPFPDVDNELLYLCGQAKQWIKNFSSQNPISIHSWMFLLSSRICPFEDGNIRMASLIASIPLMSQDIPPVLIPKSIRKEYNDVVHRAYEGHLGPLGDIVLKSLRTAIEEVVNIDAKGVEIKIILQTRFE